VFDAASARKADTKKFAKYFHVMLENGIYLPPSQFEAAFLSVAHGDEEIEATIEAARKAFAAVVAG
jgi:glutamate-1-semialdehyde 2,1-aminomutase